MGSGQYCKDYLYSVRLDYIVVVPVLEGNLHGVAPFPALPLTLNTFLLLCVLDCYHDVPPPLLSLLDSESKPSLLYVTGCYYSVCLTLGLFCDPSLVCV